MSDADNRHQAVEITDEITAALEAASTYAAAFYARGSRTLVSQFSSADVANWDGSSEMALVSDPDGIELLDEPAQGCAA